MSTAFVEFLIIGAVLGALAAGIARSVRRYETLILFVFLIVASLAYVILVLWAGESFVWLLLELTGVALYGAMGLRGLRGSPWWLAAAWALHPLWDIVLHYFGPGISFVPVSYTVACIGFDLVVAGHIAYRLMVKMALLN
jgi:uncharacterized protein DUF6010